MARDRLAALRAQQPVPVVESFPQPSLSRRPTLSSRSSFEETHESYTPYMSPSPEVNALGAFSNPFSAPSSSSPPRAPPLAALPSRRTSDPFGTPRASDPPISSFDNYSMSSTSSVRSSGPSQRKGHSYQSSIAHTQPRHERRNTDVSSHSDASSFASAQYVPILGQAYGLGVTSRVDSSMEAFFTELTLVQSETRDFDDALTRIDALHSRELSTVADSPEARRVGAELARVTEEAIRLSTSLKQRIQQLERTNGLGRDLSTSEKNVKRTQTAGAKNRFVTAVQRYSSIEADHRAACRQRLARQYRVVKPSATDDEVRQAIEDPKAGVFAQATLQAGRSDSARAALCAVQARQADLVRIEETIAELAQLFSDMAYMVEEQHDAVLDVEEKAVKVERDMEAAHSDLGRAKVSAKAARNKRKWCLIIALLALVIVGVVVAVMVLKNQGAFNRPASEPAPISSATVSSVEAPAAVVSPVVTSSMTTTVWITATATTTLVRAVTASSTAIARGVTGNGV